MMLLILPFVFVFPFLATIGAPELLKIAPEISGIVAAAVVVVRAVTHGFAQIRVVYWILVFFIALHLLFGLLVNDIGPGTAISGGRIYLRTIPFFLLALALPPSEPQLHKQFLVVLGLALLQMPLAVYQRIAKYQEAVAQGTTTSTGDVVVGTLGISSFLSIFLICVATIVVALYSRKKIGIIPAAGLLFILLLPTMINETKSTFVLLPLAIFVTMLASAERNRIAGGIKAAILVTGFAVIAIPVYDTLVSSRWDYGIIDFFTMEGRVEGYLIKDAEVGTTGQVGRIDSIRVAASELGKDPVTVVFGLGMGSVTPSSLGPQFEGPYVKRYNAFAGTTLARMFWEIGFLGAVLVIIVLVLVFIDARRNLEQRGAYGILAQAYVAVIPVIAISMLYKDLLQSPAIGICFWYFAGVVVTTARLRKAPLVDDEDVIGEEPSRR
jgi:hypothetical protein